MAFEKDALTPEEEMASQRLHRMGRIIGGSTRIWIVMLILGALVNFAVILSPYLSLVLHRDKPVAVDDPRFTQAETAIEEYRYEDAASLLEAALHDEIRAHGSASLPAARIRQMLGNSYVVQGRYDEAANMLDESYVGFKTALGGKDSNALTTLMLRSLNDMNRGREDRALADLNTVWADAEIPTIRFWALAYLFQAYADLGDYTSACDQYDLLVDLPLFERITTPDQRIFLYLQRLGVAQLTNDMNLVHEMLPQVEAWARDESLQPSVRSGAYKTLAASQQGDDAVKSARASLAIDETLYGKDSTRLLDGYSILAGALRNNGQEMESGAALAQMEAIARKTQGLHSMNTALALFETGDLLMQQSQYDDALLLFEEALEILKSLVRQDSPMAIELHDAISNACYWLGDRDRALEEEMTALRISEAQYGRDNLHTAAMCATISRIYVDNGDLDGAQPYIERAVRITQRHRQFRCYAYGLVQYRAGAYYLARKDFAAARDYFRKAERIYTDLEGVHSQNALMAWLDIGDTLRLSGDLDGAGDAYARVLREKDDVIVSRVQDMDERLEERLYKLYEAEDSSLSYQTWHAQWTTQAEKEA